MYTWFLFIEILINLKIWSITKLCANFNSVKKGKGRVLVWRIPGAPRSWIKLF